MKDLKLFIGLVLCLPFASFAQSASPIQIGPKKISAESFLQVYKPLVESDSITKDNQAAFLSDYIDYQLKIVAAEQEKLADQPDFKEEYASFRKELATPMADNGSKHLEFSFHTPKILGGLRALYCVFPPIHSLVGDMPLQSNDDNLVRNISPMIADW